MEINIPTGQDILRDIAIQYVNKAFVYITNCNPPLRVGLIYILSYHRSIYQGFQNLFAHG